ncbi:chemotaxis protein CheW [Methanosarcina hadiensis]|uniref:chemotaxis protein CheW n=1 Tax=Methanosarcina hadiensis TaxID=3078083 RepID=UPI00397729C5
MENDMAAYKSDFLQEVYECLDIYNQSFVDLENGDTAAVDEIFRITHTIKGMAGFLGYTSLEHLCHTMEEVLCGIKNGDIEIDGDLVDILLSTVDRITDIIRQIENSDNDNVKINDLVEAFKNYDKKKSEEHEPQCTLSAENNVSPPAASAVEQSEENASSSSELQEDAENGGFCSLDDCNLVLDIILVRDCAMKGLRASLIIESLKDVSRLAKTEPDESKMDKDFDGHFKVFLSGDSGKVEEVMGRNSEIEHFNISELNPISNISEINPLSNVSNEEINCTSPIPEESQQDIPPTTDASPEISPVSVTKSTDSFHSRIYGLIARMRCILSRICRSINCFKRTESAGVSAGVLQNNKCEDYPKVGPEPQELQASEQSSEISQKAIDQNLQAEETEILKQTLQKVPEKVLPDEIVPDPEVRLNKIQPQAENNENIAAQGIQVDEIQHLEGNSEKISVQGIKTPETHETEEPKQESRKQESKNYVSESASSSNTPPESKREDTIRVRTSNLDNIMNLVGELVINKGRLLQISQQYNLPELGEATSTLDKSITSLQDEVMRIRMVKIERVFSKFPRMVRDLSRKFGKNIEFEVEGQDTELDRTILDEISDPLVHLVRNSVDHGIELPDDRKKAGKSEVGHIKLSARREKNNVIIEIEDNGKGIDVEVIKRKAIEKGLLSSSDAEDLSEEEIRMLIFAPGFSTKDVATEISGRGVGMDAVKTAVEKLGGKVRVYSRKGEFTRVRIDLPPTVAIIKSLLVDVGPETFAIPISNVVKALSVDSSDYKTVKETPLLYIRDKLIPIIELREIFNISCEKLDKQIAIIVEKENEEVGLIVDSIIDQQEIVIKPLGNVLSGSRGFIGATILGDGRVIPIIDVSMLIKGDTDD